MSLNVVLPVVALSAFGGAVLWAMVLGARLEGAELRETALREAHAEALETIGALEQERARVAATLASLETARTLRNAAVTKAMKEIDDAPQTDDGPVAPVLRRALDGMRQR